MKTMNQIKRDYKKVCGALDGRDIGRLVMFVPGEDLSFFGMKVADGKIHTPVQFTRENVLAQLEKDVAFGFEKALNNRGISSSLMFCVVMMWNWVLEEGLEDYNPDTGYAQYGLPLFKATAVKYGFANPIGDDAGDEFKYSAEA